MATGYWTVPSVSSGTGWHASVVEDEGGAEEDGVKGNNTDDGELARMVRRVRKILVTLPT
jgi:hypothetical protein